MSKLWFRFWWHVMEHAPQQFAPYFLGIAIRRMPHRLREVKPC